MYFEHFILEKNSQENDYILLTMPEFSLKTIEYTQSAITHQYLLDQKKEIIIHFWATWCAPCLVELPKILEYSKNLEGRDKVPLIVLVASNDIISNVRKYLQTNGFFQSELSDRLIFAIDETQNVQKSFGTFKLPESYFFSKSGKIQQKIVGEYDWK